MHYFCGAELSAEVAIGTYWLTCKDTEQKVQFLIAGIKELSEKSKYANSLLFCHTCDLSGIAKQKDGSGY